VQALWRIAASARRALGRTVHRFGGATRADIRQLRSEREQLQVELVRALEEVTGGLERVAAHARSLERAHEDLEARVAAMGNLLEIDAVGRIVQRAELKWEPLVSVVLPTRDRPELLRRAIDSVVAQQYPHWELLVVDDGGEADSGAVVDDAADDRIRWVRIAHQGACAARNRGLVLASGEIVAYVDDDNVMDPAWLRSVVWAFEQHEEVDVLYGAFVIDDLVRVGGAASGALPRTFLHIWDREVLRTGNLADMGAIAHRSGLPEARFDESLREMGDWDLLVRLTAERDPLVLPAIACYYMTDAPNRLTGGPTQDADRAKVRGRAEVING
jgi:Glycosyl transferase family 2